VNFRLPIGKSEIQNLQSEIRNGVAMPVKSLDDLKKIKEEALAKRAVRNASARAHVTVAMGTCGIAAGARDTMKAILDAIEKDAIEGVLVTQTGCIGLCEFEPIVDVQIGETKTTYGKVSPERARAVIAEHVVGGKVIKEWIITR
jgi:NADP-reducing hydrogenase subunit HndB